MAAKLYKCGYYSEHHITEAQTVLFKDPVRTSQ